jgi:hypothetical protein
MEIDQLKNLESSGQLLIDFGQQPISNRFLPAGSLITVPSFPMQLRIDMDTGLIHQGTPFPVEELKPRYDWLTCFEPEDHLDELVNKLVQLTNVTQSSIFGAYSFKDDSTLRRLEHLGYSKTWRVDPMVDLGISDAFANVETYQQALTPDKALAIREKRGAADVLIVRHVVEHANNLPEFIAAIRAMISSGGYIIWELPDCENALATGDCTTIWEEHLFYFTSFTFKQLLLNSGFEIVDFYSVSYPLENSLVAIVREASAGTVPEVAEPNEIETEVNRAKNFIDGFAVRKADIRKKLEAWRQDQGKIAIFGAGHLSVAFLSLMNLADLIECVVDDNPHKTGMQMPLGRLPIVSSEVLYSGEISLCLLGLNPHNQPKVIANHQQYLKQGGVFGSIFPGSEHELELVL